MSKIEAKVKVAVAEKADAEINRPLHTEPLITGEAYLCPCDGRVLALKRPGEKLSTVGGEPLEAVPECPGVAAKEHGPWPHETADLFSVSINRATGRAVARRLR